jgi:hypothetical protein
MRQIHVNKLYHNRANGEVFTFSIIRMPFDDFKEKGLGTCFEIERFK